MDGVIQIRLRSATSPPAINDVRGTGIALARLFANWSQHWNVCATCHLHDWMDPGAPCISPEPDIARRPLVLKDEKRAYFSDAPDPSVLCAGGRPLFQAWILAATR